MKKIIITLLILVVLLAALLVVRNLTKAEFQGLRITYLGKDFSLQKEELKQLQLQELWADDEKFQAIEVSSVLGKFPIQTSKIRSITFISEDGGALVLKSDDLKDAYLALGKQAKKMQFRLILPSDEFRQRWLKRIVELQVR